MTWDEWQLAQLHALRQTLRTHRRELADARAIWVKIGTPPTDPLVSELNRSIRQTDDLGKLVGDVIRTVAGRVAHANRNKWVGKGFNIKLKPQYRNKFPSDGPKW